MLKEKIEDSIKLIDIKSKGTVRRFYKYKDLETNKEIIFRNKDEVIKKLRYKHEDIFLTVFKLGNKINTNSPINYSIEFIEEAEPKILIINGVDRVGKDSFIEEIDKQTKYKYITVDRGPDSFQAYCDIFNKGDLLKSKYKDIEKTLTENPNVLAIYIDCSTEELERRCKRTNHEILDFDYHKEAMEYYFDKANYQNKIKIDTTNFHVRDIVKELINKGVI